jgi:hypothetical protein
VRMAKGCFIADSFPPVSARVAGRTERAHRIGPER